MSLFHAGVAPALDTNGAPISGARWQFTLQGTTTPTPVYNDEELSSSLGSYVASDSAGRFVDIYLDDGIGTRARLWPDATMTGTPIKDIPLVTPSGASTLGGTTAESLGVSTYSPGEDQRFELQTAITAAEDGGFTLLLTQAEYEVWRDPTVPPAADYNGSLDGEFFIVRKPLRVISTHPLGTIIHFKGPNGGSLLTDYDVIDGTIYGDDKLHRGHAFFLYGETPNGDAQPDEAELPALYLENITLSTGMVADLDPVYPSSVANPNSWDLTNKCIASRGDHMMGKVELRNVTFDGWFGENTYLGGMQNDSGNTYCRLIARNWTVKNTNATFINIHGPTILDIDGMYAENCVSSWEGWAGWVYGRIANCTWTNICGSGAVGGLYYDAERRDDDTQPVLVLENITIQGTPNAAGTYPVFYAGSYLKARSLRLIDMSLNVTGLIAAWVLKNIDIDCTIECDKLSLDGAIHLHAHPDADPDSIENVQIRALMTRSDYARANSKSNSGVKFQGWAGATYGPNNTIRLRGDHSGYMNGTIAAEYGGNVFHADDIRPKIIDEGLHGTGTWSVAATSSASAHDISASATPEAGLTWVRFTFGGADVTAQYPVTLTAVTKFNDGHEITFEHSQSDCPLATVLIDGRVVLGYGDSCTFRANRQFARWDLVKGDNVMLGPLSVAGVIATGNAQATLLIPEAFTLRQVDGFLGTAQAASGGGGPLAFDVNDGVASVLSGDQAFDNTERTTRTAGTRRHVTDTALAAGAVVTLDVNVIGDGSGANLQVYLTGKWT